jgi:hypothetical protein
MDNRPSFDRPREADTPPGARHGTGALWVLGRHLETAFDVELTSDGLVVRDRNRRGNVITIICRRRPDDGDRLWFFASCGEPIAEVDRIPDTVIAINGYLAGRRP